MTEKMEKKHKPYICDECGEIKIPTRSNYWSCPKGHGKLMIGVKPTKAILREMGIET